MEPVQGRGLAGDRGAFFDRSPVADVAAKPVDLGHRRWHLPIMTKEKPLRLSDRVLMRLLEGLDLRLAAADLSADTAATGVDPTALGLMKTVQSAALSYRDGVLIQLTWGLETPGFDHTCKGEGARSTAAKLALGLMKRHIPAVRDAYQNIGKNSSNLARGNVPAFDELLRWMNSASVEQREQLLRYALDLLALSARPVLAMPELMVAQLSFGKVVGLLDELLATPSKGAHEQFFVASFLQALVDEFGFGGAGALAVRTKNINAADASSGTAADVQIVRGNRVEEAYEVTAADWKGKVDQALQTARVADLSRVHILARVANLEGLQEAVANTTTDVSVIDVGAFLRTMVAILRKPGRAAALIQIYDHLDRNQPDIARVNGYVETLRRHALTA